MQRGPPAGSRRARTGIVAVASCSPGPARGAGSSAEWGSEARELEDVETAVAVGHVHEAVHVDVAVVRLGHERPIWSGVDEPLGIGWHVVAHLAGPERVLG